MVWSPDKEFEAWWEENQDKMLEELSNKFPISGKLKKYLEEAFQKGYDYCDDLWANAR